MRSRKRKRNRNHAPRNWRTSSHDRSHPMSMRSRSLRLTRSQRRHSMSKRMRSLCHLILSLHMSSLAARRRITKNTSPNTNNQEPIRGLSYPPPEPAFTLRSVL